MSNHRDRAVTITRAIAHEIKVERITFMAGTIAYNAFLSLLPLLFVLLTIVSAVGGTELEAHMVTLTETLVTAGATDIFVSELRNASTSASLIGLVALGWGMLRIFRSLDMAFSDIYETQAENTLSDQIKDGIVVFGSIAALLVGFFAGESLLGIGDVAGGFAIFYRLVLVFVVALTLTPLYYLFPDESGMGVQEILPGALFASLGLVVLQSIFGLYVALSDPTANNQLLASIVLLLTWLYFCGLVVLVGAVINAVLSNRSTDVNITPVLGGLPKEPATELDRAQTHVPPATLDRLQHALEGDGHLRIVIGGDAEDFELPFPDSVTVESNTSSLPVINDTAIIELQWAETDQD